MAFETKWFAPQTLLLLVVLGVLVLNQLRMQSDQIQMQGELRRLRELIDEPSGSEDDESSEDRRLAQVYTLGTSASSGCFALTAAATIDLADATACTARCPACFYLADGLVTADTTVTFSNTGTAILKAAAFSGIREYMFINQDAADNLLISDGSTTFTVKPNTMIYATVKSGTNGFLFESNGYTTDESTRLSTFAGLTAAQATTLGYVGLDAGITASCATGGGITATCSR
jgi:hypothetical protein